MSADRPSTPPSRGFIAVTLRRPVSVVMALTAAMAIATIAFLKMPVELMPEGIFGGNSLSVDVDYANSSPREIEEEIVKPIEEALGTVPEIQEIWSEAREDEGEVDIEFSERADMDLAYIEVRDRLERLRATLPADADRYSIRKRGMRGIPILWMGVNFDRKLTEVSPLIDEIVRKKLERIDGVANVRIWGLAAEEIRVEIDPDALRAHRVALYPLVQRLRGENAADVSGGWVMDGKQKYYVRSMSRFKSLDEVRNYPVQEGVKLGDIATVDKAYALERYMFRAYGKRAVGMAFYKEAQANAVDVCAKVEHALEHELKTDPRLADLDFKVFFNQGTMIKASLSQVGDTALYGALFALVILYVFLRRMRMTVLITAAIPMSALAALGALYFAGGTINMLSLVGFTLAIGMLVDNSVVVVENIVRRRALGETPSMAALLGARQVGLAIFMSTLTTIVVFVPFVFLSSNGPARNPLIEVVVPLVLSLVASLAISLGAIPLATIYFVGRRKKPNAEPDRPGRLARFGRRWGARYDRVLAACLRHRFKVAMLALLFLASAPLAQKNISMTGSSMRQRSNYQVSLSFPRQFTLREASEVVADYEAMLAREAKQKNISFFHAYFNRRDGRVGVTLEKTPGYTPEDLARELEPLLPVHAGVVRRVEFQGDEESRDERRTIPIDIYGPDSRRLVEIAAEIKPRLIGLPNVTEVVTQEDEGFEEIHLRVDRTRAGKYGVDPQVIRGTIAYALQGTRLMDYPEGDRDIPMVMRFRAEDAEGIETFEKFLVRGRDGTEVPLQTVAGYGFSRGYDKIVRKNRRTLYRLSVGIDDPKRIWETKIRIDQALADYRLPQGYTREAAGSVAAITRERDAMLEMVALSIVFVFLLMGILFESFVLPATILITIPTALVGGMWALAITGTSLDGIGFLGFILLVGIVVNNGIVLVDYINRLRADGLERTDAVRQAARDRFRPILMTAMTTIGGLTPIVFSEPAREGLDYLPMSRIVGGGLVAATVFSLFLVPLTYTLLDDLRTWTRRLAGALLRLGRGRDDGTPRAA